MPQLEILESLVGKFTQDYSRYKQDDYNEASCRQEFLNPLLECFGWDVSNSQNLRFNKREVLVEQNAENNKRPDYSLTRFGIVKFFFEAKKPHVDISTDPKPAIQARKYGWNAKHPLVVLSNFEQLLIYDCSEMPTEADSASHSLFRSFNYREYVEKYDEISELISKGNCLDNSKMETFFSTLKKAIWFGRERSYMSPEELIAAIDEYIRWYNEERIQVKFKGLTPLQFRRQAFKMAS